MQRSCCRGPWARGLALACILLGAGCAALTIPEEKQLGYQFENSMRRELRYVRDRVVTDYVREMGQSLVRAAGPQPFDYQFFVVEDDEINAFAGPAGLIYVHTETILRASNASELAGVIAHEVGHVALRHIAHNYNRQRNVGIGQNILVAGASIVGGGAIGGLTNLGTGLAAAAYLNSFGREAEMEADAFAVAAMPRVHYDPNGLVTFFEMLLREGGPQAPGFLSSHPATKDRIDATLAAIGALPIDNSVRSDDGGRFEIIQRRVELLTHRSRR